MTARVIVNDCAFYAAFAGIGWCWPGGILGAAAGLFFGALLVGAAVQR